MKDTEQYFPVMLRFWKSVENIRPNNLLKTELDYNDKTNNIGLLINDSYCCFLDALSELSENDDENLDEFDDGDGGGSLHHLYMLIISIALSSVLTYLFCMFS